MVGLGRNYYRDVLDDVLFPIILFIRCVIGMCVSI